MDFLRRVLKDTTNKNKRTSLLAVLSKDLQVQEMDAAIAILQNDLKELRTATRVQQEHHRQERDQLRLDYFLVHQQLTDELDGNHVVNAAHLTPYTRITKQVREYIVPGIVATLQAQLCLHLHAMCAHHQQVALLTQSTDELIWWYEDMRRQCQVDQAQNEMEYMNRIVQAQIQVGALVDQKALHERQAERQQHNNSIRSSQNSNTMKSVRRTFSRTISSAQSNSNIISTKGRSSIVLHSPNPNIPRRIVSRKIRTSHSNRNISGTMSVVIMPANFLSSSTSSPTSRASLLMLPPPAAAAAVDADSQGVTPEQLSKIIFPSTLTTGHRQRVVRDVSKRGTALRPSRSPRSSSLAASVTASPNTTPLLAKNSSTNNTNDNNDNYDNDNNASADGGDDEMHQRRQPQQRTSMRFGRGSISDDLGDDTSGSLLEKIMHQDETSTTEEIGSSMATDTAATAALSIADRRANRAKSRLEARKGRRKSPRRPKDDHDTTTVASSKSTITNAPNRHINSMRSRPMARAVVRKRSKSLTSSQQQETRRAGRKFSAVQGSSSSSSSQELPQLQQPQQSEDDSNVGVKPRGALLCGFPTRQSPSSVVVEEKRDSLLRGFASSMPVQEEEAVEVSEQLTTTLRNWMGTMTVKLQESQQQRQAAPPAAAQAH